MTIEDLRVNIDGLFAQARDPKCSDAEKKRLLAEAMAYYREMRFAGENGEVHFDTDRVNRALDTVYNGATFREAKTSREISELASLSPEQLDKRLRNKEADVNRYAAGDENSVKRAKNVFKKFADTWRVKGNSKEFDAAKNAMQSIADRKTPPSQTDYYLAAETVKKYVAKNLQAAKSATGRTRMACALTFLKQTMPPESFKAYCDGLNALRGINRTITENGIQFEKKDPRCIVPDEIGTVKEVYDTVRERFHQYSLDENLEISPRDLATLTALKNLQAKSSEGENMIVEHEALQTEIEKVENDRRFQDAIQSRSRDELIEMAWWGNINTIEGYAQPLRPDQRERVEAEKARREQDRIQKLAAAKRMKEQKEKQKQEEIKKEQERIKKEQEEAQKEQERIRQEQERRKVEKPLSDLYEEVKPELDKMEDSLDSVFSQLEDDHPEKSTELAAKLIALGEIYDDNFSKPGDQRDPNPDVNLAKFNKRVEELKKDLDVQEMGKKLKEDPNVYKELKDLKADGAKKKNETLRSIYPGIRMSLKLHRQYDERTKKIDKQSTVEDGYRQMESKVDKIIDGKMNYQDVAKSVAIFVALREEEQKVGRQGLVDPQKLKARVLELIKDPSITAAGQTLSGPTKRAEITKNLTGKPDRMEKFIGMAEKAYEQAKLEKEKRKNAKKEKKEPEIEKKKELQGP